MTLEQIERLRQEIFEIIEEALTTGPKMPTPEQLEEMKEHYMDYAFTFPVGARSIEGLAALGVENSIQI